MPNIEVETRLDSLPHRQVLLNFKFINHDDRDYYFMMQGLCSIYGGKLEINNTRYADHTTNGWFRCPSRSCPPPIRYSDISKIPAKGVFQEAVDIVQICYILYDEPTGSQHYLRYAPEGAGWLGFLDIHNQYIGGITMFSIELPFTLIDSEEEKHEEELGRTIESAHLDLTPAGATAVESATHCCCGFM